MNCRASIFPSLKRRGGCGINQISRSHRIAADGVVRSAKAFRPNDFAGLTTPSARTKVASRYFWPAHPPLLFKEGNRLARQFIPHLHRPRLQFKSPFCKGLLEKEGNMLARQFIQAIQYRISSRNNPEAGA